MATPDLASARAAAEAIMADRGALTRDSEFETDDTLDPTTLQLTPSATDRTTIYEGRCFVGSPNDIRGREASDARASLIHRYRIRLPVRAGEPRVGDRFTLSSCRHDPALVGKEMRVVDVRLHSLLVTRQMVCELAIGERQ